MDNMNVEMHWLEEENRQFFFSEKMPVQTGFLVGAGIDQVAVFVFMNRFDADVALEHRRISGFVEFLLFLAGHVHSPNVSVTVGRMIHQGLMSVKSLLKSDCQGPNVVCPDTFQLRRALGTGFPITLPVQMLEYVKQVIRIYLIGSRYLDPDMFWGKIPYWFSNSVF